MRNLIGGERKMEYNFSLSSLKFKKLNRLNFFFFFPLMYFRKSILHLASMCSI